MRGQQHLQTGKQKVVGASSMVERERVVCENCRFQFRYLYDRKRSKKPVNVSETQETRKDLAALRSRYADLHACYNPCPHCGYVQEWMVRAKRFARIQDFGFIGLYAALFLSLASVAVMLYAAMNATGASAVGPLSGFGRLYVSAVGCYMIFGFLYIPYVARIWSPNRHVDRSCYEATRAATLDEKQRQRDLEEYRLATQQASRLGRVESVSLEQGLSVRGKALIFASCALAVVAFFSPSLFPQMVVTLSASGLMMLPFYVGIVFLLITTIGGSWKFIYRMML